MNKYITIPKYSVSVRNGKCIVQYTYFINHYGMRNNKPAETTYIQTTFSSLDEMNKKLRTSLKEDETLTLDLQSKYLKKNHVCYLFSYFHLLHLIEANLMDRQTMKESIDNAFLLITCAMFPSSIEIVFPSPAKGEESGNISPFGKKMSNIDEDSIYYVDLLVEGELQPYVVSGEFNNKVFCINMLQFAKDGPHNVKFPNLLLDKKHLQLNKEYNLKQRFEKNSKVIYE